MRRWLLISGLIGVAVALVRLATADACQVPQNCVRGGCSDAGSYNCSNLPTASAPPDAGPPAYLIPEDASAVGHWNATDLANGTAKIGAPWSTVGTVAFETGVAVRPGVGPFPSGNYYKQTSGAFSFLAAPFTEVAIWYGAPTGTEQVLLGTQNQELNVGTTNTSGFYYGSNLYPANAPVSSPSINVTFGGIDGSGNCWAQLNGGTAVSTSCSYVGISAQDALGVYAGDLATFPATGLKLVEAYATTAVPSAGAFTAIYNQILENE